MNSSASIISYFSLLSFLLFAGSCGESGMTSFENTTVKTAQHKLPEEPSSEDGTRDELRLERIEIRPADAVIFVDETIKYTAVAVYTNNYEIDITEQASWQSTNPDVAGFTAEPGTLLGKANGSTEIIAKASGKEGSTRAEITSSKVTSVRVDPSTALFGIEQEQEFKAFATVEGLDTEKDVTELVEWTIATPEVLGQGSGSNFFKGIGLGNTQLTAQYRELAGTSAVTIADAEMIEPAPINSMLQLSVNDKSDDFSHPQGSNLKAVWTTNEMLTCKFSINGEEFSSGLQGNAQTSLSEETTFILECKDSENTSHTQQIIVKPTLPEISLKINNSIESQDILIGTPAVIDVAASYVNQCQLYFNDIEIVLDDTQKTLDAMNFSASTTLNGEEAGTIKVNCTDSAGNEASKSLDLGINTPQLLLTANGSPTSILLSPESTLVLELTQSFMSECTVKATENELFKGADSSYKYETVFNASTNFSASCKDALNREYQSTLDVTLLNDPQLVLEVAGMQVGPISIAQNSTQEISWSAVNAEICTLRIGNTNISTDLAGTMNYQFSTGTTVSFNCENLLGVQSSKTIDVAVTTPNVTLYINGTNNNYEAAPNEQVMIAYTAENASACSLSHAGNDLGNQNPRNYRVNLAGELLVDCTDEAGNQASDALSLGLKIVNINGGLAGGHFDADTFEGSDILKHQHAYDVENNTTGIVYHGPNQASGDLRLLASDNVSSSTIFKISFENANLSKGAWLKINDQFYNWENLPPANQTYSISNANADVLISELSVIYSINAIQDGAIACSDPGDVKDDPNNRNGALTLKLRSANNSLLWEGVTYWHDNDCRL